MHNFQRDIIVESFAGNFISGVEFVDDKVQEEDEEMRTSLSKSGSGEWFLKGGHDW